MPYIKALGGIFIKSPNPTELRNWYNNTLGINFDDFNASVLPVTEKDLEIKAHSVFGIFEKESNYFAPSEEKYMINFRVENFYEYISILKKKGVNILKDPIENEFGIFTWIMDPEGRKIELWEIK